MVDRTLFQMLQNQDHNYFNLNQILWTKTALISDNLAWNSNQSNKDATILFINNISWPSLTREYRNNKISVRYQFMENKCKTRSTLTIKNPTHQDAGMYACITYSINNHGENYSPYNTQLIKSEVDVRIGKSTRNICQCYNEFLFY